jgi:two-component system, OmpR family, response regulator
LGKRVKILLLEDDFSLGMLMHEHLAATSRCVWVKSISEAFEACEKDKFDLLLLDVNLPDGSGFEFLQELRSCQDKTPAIFVTALGGSKELRRGFELGCDDYIRKPFDFDELDARIEHVKKIYAIEAKERIDIDDEIFFEPSTLTVHNGITSTKLRPMEAKVLSYFLAHQNRFISYEELSRALWSFDDTPDEATIRSYIKSIRKALNKEFITNQRGVGYRFERL